MTKFINIIYSQINSNVYLNKSNKKEINNISINNNENKDLDNNNIYNNNNALRNIIYKKNEKMKNKVYYYKKINNNQNSATIKELQLTKNNYDNNINNEDIKRDTDLIFASIPSEPSPKLIPESKNYKEIKKLSTYFNLNKVINNPFNNKNESIHISNTSRNKRSYIYNEKDNKNENKISHVKSFSLGQNIQNISELKDNRLKIIISINNTQNKNYIHKKNSRKFNNFNTKNKHLLSKYLEENYIMNQNAIGMYKKINPVQQIMNYHKKNNYSKKIIKILIKYIY